MTRIAVVGDIHYDGGEPARLARLCRDAAEEADVIAFCGDLTTHGEPEQADGFGRIVGEEVGIPVVSVLGNHDHEADRAGEAREVLEGHGITVLDGESCVIEGVGFAGVKGFCGGFGRGALAAFGEALVKRFVQEAVDEALRLENALRTLDAGTRVVLLHYAPVAGTVEGEPEVIWPFLGSSRLTSPLDDYGVDVCFHGHAHTGSREGRTPGGVPVHNVALPLLEAHGRSFLVWEAEEGIPA